MSSIDPTKKDRQYGQASQQGSYQQKSEDDIVAIVAKGPTTSQFTAKAGTEARSLHLRNPRTREEMFIQLLNRDEAGQQASSGQQSSGTTGQQETWEVINSKNI